MNFRYLFWQAFALLYLNGQAQLNSAEQLLKQVHSKYYHGPCKIYSFSQRNFHFRNDSVIRTSIWHEAIEFPDKFRISFGDKTNGNYVYYRNDSAYNFREGKFLKSRSDSSSLLLILGGMFYREWPEVRFRLKRAGYNTSVLSEQIWKGKPVYVIGAAEKDESSNQIWIDKESLRVLRIIESIPASGSMDMRFESHQVWCNGYVETKVSFRRNGMIEQVEEYFNIREETKFPD